MYCFTETWLSSFVCDNEIVPSGYTIFSKDRGTRGGGVLVAIKDSIPFKQMPSPSCLEVITVSVCLSDSLILSLIHSPPMYFTLREVDYSIKDHPVLELVTARLIQ